MYLSTCNISINPTSPLGCRWFRGNCNQNSPSPSHPPGHSIRRVWIRRGRTSFSPNPINCLARASKSAVLNRPSRFVFSVCLLPLGV